MNIKENDRVKVIAGTQAGKIGKVSRTYDVLNMAVVICEDGSVIKASYSALEKVAPEIPEGAKRITKTEYSAALDVVCDPKRIPLDKLAVGIVANTTNMIVGLKLYARMFERESEVVMTEAQFMDALWECCSPSEVAIMCDNSLSPRKCTAIGIGAVTCLRKIADILFNESGND